MVLRLYRHLDLCLLDASQQRDGAEKERKAEEDQEIDQIGGVSKER